MHETKQFQKADHPGEAALSFYELIKFRSHRKGDQMKKSVITLYMNDPMGKW